MRVNTDNNEGLPAAKSLNDGCCLGRIFRPLKDLDLSTGIALGAFVLFSLVALLAIPGGMGLAGHLFDSKVLLKITSTLTTPGTISLFVIGIGGALGASVVLIYLALPKKSNTEIIFDEDSYEKDKCELFMTHINEDLKRLNIRHCYFYALAPYAGHRRIIFFRKEIPDGVFEIPAKKEGTMLIFLTTQSDLEIPPMHAPLLSAPEYVEHLVQGTYEDYLAIKEGREPLGLIESIKNLS